MNQPQPARTITVTSPAWKAPLRVHYPDGTRPTWRTLLTRRFPRHRPCDLSYDPHLAIELIANTSDIPESRYDLIVVLTEYRHALHDLATQALTTTTP